MSAKAKARLYQQVLALLPGRHEAEVTACDQLRLIDLQWMTSKPGQSFSGEDALEYEHAVEQECHAAAAHAWLSNPGWQLVLGFAYSEERTEELSAWHFHSFCLDEAGNVVEPTPYGRAAYWGVILDDVKARQAVQEELPNIANLNIPTPDPSRLG